MADAVELIGQPFSGTLPVARSLPPSSPAMGIAALFGFVLVAIWLVGTAALGAAGSQ